MTHDALGAHARDELGVSETLRAQPVQAALASAASFAIGAVLPLAVTALVPSRGLIPWVSVTSIAFLAALGGLSARVGGAGVLLGAWRVTFWARLRWRSPQVWAGCSVLPFDARLCGLIASSPFAPCPIAGQTATADRLRALSHRPPQGVGVAWVGWHGLQTFLVVSSEVGRGSFLSSGIRKHDERWHVGHRLDGW